MLIKIITVLSLLLFTAVSCVNSGTNQQTKLSTEEAEALDKVVPVEDAAAMKTFNITAQFPSGSANLTSEGKAQIKDAGDYIKNNTDKIKAVFIEGHSDSQGPDEFNRLLSERRAQMVKNYLVRSFGVNSELVRAIGYGESSPIADNATAEGRLKNRRVIIKVK